MAMQHFVDHNFAPFSTLNTNPYSAITIINNGLVKLENQIKAAHLMPNWESLQLTVGTQWSYTNPPPGTTAQGHESGLDFVLEIDAYPVANPQKAATAGGDTYADGHTV